MLFSIFPEFALNNHGKKVTSRELTDLNGKHDRWLDSFIYQGQPRIEFFYVNIPAVLKAIYPINIYI